jgi:hypothetical protein
MTKDRGLAPAVPSGSSLPEIPIRRFPSFSLSPAYHLCLPSISDCIVILHLFAIAIRESAISCVALVSARRNVNTEWGGRSIRRWSVWIALVIGKDSRYP